MTLKLSKSHMRSKRYRIDLADGRHYDFGLEGGQTYIDHKDKTKRSNYFKRHMANPKEKYLIDNLIPSPAFFSAKILWGNHTHCRSLNENLKELNKQMTKKRNHSVGQ